MSFWKNKRVLVTAGCGFIGSHLVLKLLENNANVTVLDNLSNGKTNTLGKRYKDVQFIKGDCKDMTTALKASRGKDIVMNLAARVSGVGYNIAHPATMLSDNLLIETVMIEAARRADVGRFLVVSSAVVYSNNSIIPTPESEGFKGYPDEPNKGYGWAKRVGELLGQYYYEEFGMPVAIVRPYNCYGPGDHFFPEPTHVVPSIIRRIVDGEDPVVVWGSGKQTRAFLYVNDLVMGMMLAVEKYPVADPVNLGTDEEVTIATLVKKIITISRKHPKVVFDTTKPDGSMRRNSDNSKAKSKLGFVANTSLEVGLTNTIRWYNENKARYI